MKYTGQQLKAIKDLLFKMADDQLILGHRNSEWTGLGPLLEEDIAFSSIAQDKIGQSLALYTILHELGEAVPDAAAFMRNASEFKCCRLVEYPIGEYNFSLMRNFLFGHADYLRFEMLCSSAFEPLAKTAKKFKGEIKYHTMHGDTWIKQLGRANEESHQRMQKALDDTFSPALGIFEPGAYETELNGIKIFPGEKILETKWLETVMPLLENASLIVPAQSEWKPVYGGRKGVHTEYLQPLINEMGAVFRLDPKAEW
jgi:ring-1,2-phenylacetyl-CoA epoxidase subunit PaaC